MSQLAHNKEKPKIYQYLDYRLFLQDLIDHIKQVSPAFTLKSFAQKAGLKSLGLLKMVMDGDRRLTLDTLQGFCMALDIKGKEKNYFETLVRYNHTDNPDAKRDFFEELSRLRPRSQQFTLEKKHHRYLTNDYYVTLREMVMLHDFKEDDAWMASRCAPPISSQLAREGIDTLLELGLLKRDENGRLIQSKGFVHTPDGKTTAIEAYHFHDAVLSKARHALGYLKQDQRQFYALTLPLPKELAGEIIDDFYRLRDKIVEKASQAGLKYDEVYQMNFQFFPTTLKKDGEDQ